MKIIGIDIGTTTISTVVMDSCSLTVVHKRTIKNNSFLPTQQPWERIQDAQNIVDSPACLIWGTLKGMAKELYDFYRVLNKHAGIFRRKLVAAGNGIRRNEALQHILSNQFGLPLTVEQNEEEAALGSAISSLAMIESISFEQWLNGRHR